MTIVVNLSPEMEERLQKKAIQRGEALELVATSLLADLLDWEAQDSEEAIVGIQRGLDDFEAGRFRSFEAFEQEQRQKYNLPS
jgi:predicted transcriptional regulator